MPLSLTISAQKAYAAMNFNTPGSAMAGRFTSPVEGIVLSEGSLPIAAGGTIPGGIGVSGAPSGELDEACAQAGLDAINDDLELAFDWAGGRIQRSRGLRGLPVVGNLGRPLYLVWQAPPRLPQCAGRVTRAHRIDDGERGHGERGRLVVRHRRGGGFGAGARAVCRGGSTDAGG